MARRQLAVRLDDGGPLHIAKGSCDCSPDSCSCPESLSSSSGSHTYSDPTVSNIVTERFRKFYRDGTFTDVSVRAGSYHVKAHKLILAASSTFFQAQFSFEKNSFTGTLDDIELMCDGSLLKDVIDYIYFGTITITRYNVMGLMELQDYLQVACLRNLINNFVRCQMNDSRDCFVEALKLKQITECYRYQDLASDLFLHIREKFNLFLHKPEFLEVPLELFIECLNSDFLVVGVEDDLLLTICTWVCFDHSRSSYIEKLLKYVDPSRIVRWSETQAKALAIFDQLPNLRDRLDGWFCNDAELRRFTSDKGGHSRYKTVMKPVLMSIGGFGDEPANSSIFEACANTLPTVTVDCIVSWYREKWKPMIPTVNIGCPGKECAVPVPLMKHPRAFPIVAYDGFNVYVAGGGTNCVEVYRSTKNQWFPLPDVPDVFDLDKTVMAVLDGSVYLLGARLTDGWNVPGDPLFMVLHKDSKSWHSLTPPDLKDITLINSSYKPPSLVASLSCLYLLTSGQTREAKLIRKYDVDFDVWSTVGSHPVSGCDHICACVAFSHIIFIIFNIGVLYMYNTITQEWNSKGSHRNLPLVEDVNHAVSTRYSSYISSKFGCEIVLADEYNTITQEWINGYGHPLADDVNRPLSSWYVPYISSKFGNQLVIYDQSDSSVLHGYGQSGQSSTWLNLPKASQRRPHSGLAHFYLALYEPLCEEDQVGTAKVRLVDQLGSMSDNRKLRTLFTNN